MARTGFGGFEVGAIAAEGTVTGSVAIESSIVRTGAYSLKLTPASGAAGHWTPATNPSGVNYRFRFYLRATVLPATARQVLSSSSATSDRAFLFIDPAGTVTYKDGTGSSQGTSSVALTDTTRWYCIELRPSSVSPGSTNLVIDGVHQVTGGGSINRPGERFGATDTVAATYTAYVDDWAYDDTDPIGEGKVVMLLPTSLNAAGGWVEGDGAGTAGMAAAVATRPPPGVASASETAATNIESPTNSATDNCDMNMTTYAAAGIAPFDTVQAIRGVVRHGEDIATATKAGALATVSNPAQGGEDAFNFGNDLGAHAGEAGLWATSFGTIQTAAVELQTAPVFRVGKRTATTRVVCVDFMGIYVEFMPGMAPSRPRLRHYPQLLAH